MGLTVCTRAAVNGRVPSIGKRFYELGPKRGEDALICFSRLFDFPRTRDEDVHESSGALLPVRTGRHMGNADQHPACLFPAARASRAGRAKRLLGRTWIFPLRRDLAPLTCKSPSPPAIEIYFANFNQAKRRGELMLINSRNHVDKSAVEAGKRAVRIAAIAATQFMPAS